MENEICAIVDQIGLVRSLNIIRIKNKNKSWDRDEMVWEDVKDEEKNEEREKEMNWLVGLVGWVVWVGWLGWLGWLISEWDRLEWNGLDSETETEIEIFSIQFNSIQFDVMWCDGNVWNVRL